MRAAGDYPNLMPIFDPVDLTQRLVRCASVTPTEGGALDLLADVLSASGFNCTRVDRNGTPNLFARWGDRGHVKTLGFNGHTDVVPPGDETAWRFPPFSATVEDGKVWGRGSTDMKSGVAAFVSAAIEAVETAPPDGALILAITGDEEGPATDGTTALLDWMAAEGEAMSHCLVGEPTCPEVMGDMIKIGRRGSMTAIFEAYGVQGHTAYLHRAKNAAAALAMLMHRLTQHELDQGTAHFDPSTVAVTTIDVGNTATNVVPSKARAVVNIRFTDAHTGRSLTEWLEREAAQVAKETGVDVSVSARISGESFVTEPGPFSDLIARAVEAETGVVPVLSTSGGTSDARFVKDHCPVVEFGLVGRSMHQVDEHVEIAHIRLLKQIYARIIHDYFA